MFKSPQSIDKLPVIVMVHFIAEKRVVVLHYKANIVGVFGRLGSGQCLYEPDSGMVLPHLWSCGWLTLAYCTLNSTDYQRVDKLFAKNILKRQLRTLKLRASRHPSLRR